LIGNSLILQDSLDDIHYSFSPGTLFGRMILCHY
jgi:hypothetical protein